MTQVPHHWLLRTATSTYAVALAPDEAGLVLQDWTDGEPRPWEPTDVHGFRLPIDRQPLEYAALGSRQAGGVDLVVDHGEGLVGARLVWRAEDVRLEKTSTGSTLTATDVDTTGDLGLTLIIETSQAHDVISKSVTISNTGLSVLTLPRAFGPAWE
ncbi:hypothetical protein, partial [Bradyrhizobium sp. NBAIM08]|uniref:hypothetical protein n=1 Tax=Bradyrhizobium sp. NBAIM08 TaxID=2793815 RepID=UPI001CD7D795